MLETTLFPKSWIAARPDNPGIQVGNFAFFSSRAGPAGTGLLVEISAIARRA